MQLFILFVPICRYFLQLLQKSLFTNSLYNKNTIAYTIKSLYTLADSYTNWVTLIKYSSSCRVSHYKQIKRQISQSFTNGVQYTWFYIPATKSGCEPGSMPGLPRFNARLCARLRLLNDNRNSSTEI